MKKVKQFIIITITCSFLACGSYGCIKSHDYQDMNDDKWLTEQVEKGYLTQEEADAIRKENANK